MREKYPRVFDALIWPAAICGDAAMMLIFTSAAFLALWRLGGEHADLAYVGGAYWLVYVPLAPLWARLGGRIGVRRVSIGGAVVILGATLLLSLVDSLPALCQVMGLLGVGASAMWPNIEAELARGREGPILRRRLAVFNLMWNCGLVLGPLLGALVVPEKVAVEGPSGRELLNTAFLTATALAAGMILCLALWRASVPDAAQVRLHLERDGGRDPVRLRAFWLMAFVANFMAYVVIGVLRHLYEKLASAQWADTGTASERHHTLLMIMALASVSTYAVLIFAHRWHYRLKRHLAWQVALAGGLLLVSLTGDVLWAAVGFVIVGAATAFVYSGSLFYSIEGHDETTHMAGWHEAVLGSGSLAGLLLTGHVPKLLHWFGVVDEYWLVRSPYLAATCLFAVGILVQLGIYCRHMRRFGSSERASAR